MNSYLFESLKTQDLYSSLLDPLGLKPILEKFCNTIGLIVLENKRWAEVISCCFGPSVECCDLLEQLRERLARTPPNVQQSREQYVFFFFLSNFHF